MEKTDPINMTVSNVGDKVLQILVEKKFFNYNNEAAKFLALYALEKNLDHSVDLIEYKIVSPNNKWDSAAFSDVTDMLFLLRGDVDLPYTRIRSLIDLGARDVSEKVQREDFRISELL